MQIWSGDAMTLTKYNEGLLGRVRLVLFHRMSIVVNDIAAVSHHGADREVGDSPCPSEGPAQLARLGLGSLVGKGSSESNTARVWQLHGD